MSAAPTLYDWAKPDRSLETVEPPVRSSGGYGVDAESRYEDVYLGGPDINPDLHGFLKYQVYREMMVSDPVVRSVLWLYKLPIRAARWKLEPASDDAADQQICDYITELFGIGKMTSLIDLTWDGWLQQSLKYLEWGAQFEELVWQRDVVEWKDPQGNSRIVRHLARMAPRSAPSIDRIETDDLTGQISRLRQEMMPADAWIPGDVIQHYILEKEGGSWWGQSLLRAMYGPWKLKKGLMIAAGVAFDRWAAGTPVVRYPKNDPAAERRANQIGRSVRTHERGYVTLEGTSEEGWDVNILNGTGSIADPVNLLRHYDGQITQAGLAQFGQLGTTDRGSRAVGDTISEPFYLAVQSIANHLIEERTRQTFRRIVNVNFGTEYDLPVLSVSKIQARNLVVIAQALADLNAAGLSFVDRDTQNDIRDLFNLRHLPDVDEALAVVDEELGTEAGLAITPSRVAPVEGGSIAA